MSTEKFANDASSTLNGSINSIVTSLIVTSATPFPSAGQFRIRIDLEILLVTGVSGTTFTVTRGVEGTTATSHANGAVVAHIITAGSLAQARADATKSLSRASTPSAGNGGNLQFDSDSPYLQLDNGSIWLQYALKSPPLTEPSSGSFTLVGAGSQITTNGGIYLYGSTSLSNAFGILKKSAPATPYTVTAALLNNMPPFSAGLCSCGLLFRDSASGKYVCFEHIYTTTNGLAMAVENYSATNTYNATLAGGDNYPGTGLIWMRIQDDGTDRIYSLSINGVHWTQYYKETRTNYLTANEVGFFINPLLGSGGSTTRQPVGGVHLLHWLET